MTFSVAVRDPSNNTLGIAISTKLIAVGSLCPFIRYGAGAVCTQALVNPRLGPLILNRLAIGENAKEALNNVMANETDAKLRQVGVIDSLGGSFAYTGSDTHKYAGHKTGENYSIQGKLLVSEDTLIAMEKVITTNTGWDLSELLLNALEAGQQAGGDRRGRQSAALLVHNDQVFPLVDLRVDEHPNPVIELRRIFELAKREGLFKY